MKTLYAIVIAVALGLLFLLYGLYPRTARAECQLLCVDGVCKTICCFGNICTEN